MKLTGISDEATNNIDGQIRAFSQLNWKELECRNVDGQNLTLIDDASFDTVCTKLEAAGMGIACFASSIGNWTKNLQDPPDTSYLELQKAIPRMKVFGTTLLRVMSFKVPEDQSINDPVIEQEVIRRMRYMVKVAEDAGIILVHENCDTWGGRSYEHTLKLLDAINSPSFKLAFDTGNPVFRKDVRGKAPFVYQNSWEFYENVKEHIVHVHIKDGKMVNDVMQYSYPGLGDGNVITICNDLRKSGYKGYISIEPHLNVVFHDNNKSVSEADCIETFVAYGKQMEKILSSFISKKEHYEISRR